MDLITERITTGTEFFTSPLESVSSQGAGILLQLCDMGYSERVLEAIRPLVSKSAPLQLRYRVLILLSGIPVGIPLLLQMLRKKSSSSMRRVAITSAMISGDVRCIEDLRALSIWEDDPKVRLMAQHALAELQNLLSG